MRVYYRRFTTKHAIQIFLHLGRELIILLAIPSSDLTVKVAKGCERMTCGSLVVILAKKTSSCSCMLSYIIDTLKHTRVSFCEKVRKSSL